MKEKFKLFELLNYLNDNFNYISTKTKALDAHTILMGFNDLKETPVTEGATLVDMVIAAIGHGTLGIILFSISAANVGIVWNFTNIIYVISIIIGGVLIQGAIFLFTSTCNFYFLNSSQSLQQLFFWNGRKVATYPISIFKSFIQYFIIFIVPFAFVNYFPAEFLMNKIDNVYPNFVYYLAPFVGVAM